MIVTLFGCYGLTQQTKLEETLYLGLPQITRIDDGTCNSKGDFKIKGYFNYELEERKKEIFEDKEVSEPNLIIPETVVYDTFYYAGISYQPEKSVGFDFLYSFNSVIGLGFGFDYASKEINNVVDTAGIDRYTSILFGIHPRITRNKGIVSLSYQPEFLFGMSTYKLNEYRITESETSFLGTSDKKKFYLGFNQSGTLRVDPIEYIGFFGGVQHTYKPYFIKSDNYTNRHNLIFYIGVGSEIIDMINWSIYFAKPNNLYSSEVDQPISLGFSAGINLKSQK